MYRIIRKKIQSLDKYIDIPDNHFMTSETTLQITLVLFKPDAIRRGLSGEILTRLEKIGLKIRALKLVHATPELAGQHYSYEDIAVRHGEAVRNQLITFITSGPVLALALEGDQAIEIVRKLCGPTEPLKAPPGTIRGDYCHQSFALSTIAGQSIRNVIHASANPEDAARELALWFDPSEYCSYKRNDEEEHLF